MNPAPAVGAALETTTDYVMKKLGATDPRKAERAAIVAFIRERIAASNRQSDRGRISAAEGSHLSRWLGAMADDIDAGLHSEGADQP